MNCMKIALLGAMGFVGQTAARALARHPEVRDLLLVDYNIRETKKFGRALSPKCRWAMADVGRAPELMRLLDDVDAVANAVGPCREYEKTVLLTCAGAKLPTASIGDGTLTDTDRDEVHETFRRMGVMAVSGCGILPGWTELLAAHFLSVPSGGRRTAEPLAEAGTAKTGDQPAVAPGEDGPSEKGISTWKSPEIDGRNAAKAGRFLFFSPDRFGGYAFFRRIVREIGLPAPIPPYAPDGRYFETGEGTVFGLPEGRPARLGKSITSGLGIFGAVGREMSSAFLFWLRRSLRPATGTHAAAAGVFPADRGPGRIAAISDPNGQIPGTLLAETVLRVGQERGKAKGLLPLPGILGRKDAERIAAACGGEIRVG
jgi:hypothetical protein